MICERCGAEFDENDICVDIAINGRFVFHANAVETAGRKLTLCQICLERYFKDHNGRPGDLVIGECE